MGKVWALFTDQTACEIKLNKMDVDQTDDLTLKPVAINDMRTKNSAEKAMLSAFSILKKIHKINNNPYCFTYEFKSTSTVLDSSASLAFGLGLVNKFKRFTFSIAATGIIDESSPTATVKPVNEIETKLLAAASVLGSGDVILYPHKNHSEISGYSTYSKKGQYFEWDIDRISPTILSKCW